MGQHYQSKDPETCAKHETQVSGMHCDQWCAHKILIFFSESVFMMYFMFAFFSRPANFWIVNFEGIFCSKQFDGWNYMTIWYFL